MCWAYKNIKDKSKVQKIMQNGTFLSFKRSFRNISFVEMGFKNIKQIKEDQKHIECT